MSKNKKGNCKVRDMDMISNLPEELIVGILSKLHLKDAGKTSVLSKRWRHLWTYLTDLDFDDYKTHYFLAHVNDRSIKVNKYVNWVTQVLYAGRTLHLNSLKIHFTLDNTFTSYVNHWFHFAMSTKQVKHLYLNLGTCAIESIGNACYLKPITYISINENLQSLSLVSVYISDQLVESILAHCPNLEHLSLSHCDQFTHLKLVASSASSYKLKQLVMRDCFDASDVEIYAPNLTCFTFKGIPSHYVNFLHVPNLTEVAFGTSICFYLLENLHGSYSEYIIKYLDSFLSISSQLHKVSLSLYTQMRCSSSALGAAFGNLKQLELIVPYDYNCVLLTSFIEACPLLETFKLMFMIIPLVYPEYVTNLYGAEIEEPKQVHKKLKAIEYGGVLIGSESSVKLARWLTKQSLFLETFLFDCCLPDDFGKRRIFYGDWSTHLLRLSSETARSLANEIRRLKSVNIAMMGD